MRRDVEVLPTIFEGRTSDAYRVARDQSIKTSDFLAKLKEQAKKKRVKLMLWKMRRLHVIN